MSNKAPNSRRNLDIAIERIAQGSIDPVQIRRAIANTVIGQLLEEGTVKGGSALKIRYGNSATRFSRDLDTARADDLDTFIGKLGLSLEKGWGGFTGVVVRREPAHPKDIAPAYVMQPFDIKLSYNGKSWLTVPLEVGFNEIGDADEPEYAISSDIVELFLSLGLPSLSPVPLMQLPYQIAQKLHGVSESGSKRAHDLVDLQIIESQSDIDYGETRKVCERLFTYRKRQEWPSTITAGNSWDILYGAAREGLDV